jgi:protein-tyrosine phosphatase
LIRSDHLGKLTDAGREAMLGYGVGVVIDLRSPGEVTQSPSPFAAARVARYLHLPLVDDRNMRRLGESEDMLERYLLIVNRRPDAFRDVFAAIAGQDGGVLFHCFAGKDRTGLVAAMLLELAGVSRDEIARDYGATDVQLAQQYELWIAEAEPERRDTFRAELRCPPERIAGVLDHLDRRWGGVEAYLEAAGLPAASIDRLAARLV